MKSLTVWHNVLFVGVALLLLAAQPVGATSLFQTSPASMFADQKARQVGDLVTVIIMERAQASQSAGAQTSAGASTTFGASGVLADLLPMLGFGTNRSSDGGGSTNRAGSISGQLTTRVVDVYANGTMKIQGRQAITVNGDEQEIIISGLVRGRDIQPDNTIESPLVADADIQFVGSGPMDEEQKQGLITRILKWLF